MATTRSLVAKVALGAINSANVKYEMWSKGWWVGDSGVEGLMTANIAEALALIQENDESLVMELEFQYIVSESGVKLTKENIEALGPNRRVDIALFDRSGAPAFVIEVKRLWTPSDCYSDLKRLRDLIRTLSTKSGGSLKSGFLATMLAKKATTNLTAVERIEQEFYKIEEGLESSFDHKEQTIKCYFSTARKYPQEYREAHSQQEWASAAICIEVLSA